MMRRLAAIVCATLLASLAHAQSYPNRPVRVIVPYPAGGGTDIVIRGIQPPLTERLGQQLVVDSRPGAGGLIGAELAARAVPDIVAAVRTPEAKTRLNADGVEAVGSTPQALLELRKGELATWGPLVKESGAKPD